MNDFQNILDIWIVFHQIVQAVGINQIDHHFLIILGILEIIDFDFIDFEFIYGAQQIDLSHQCRGLVNVWKLVILGRNEAREHRIGNKLLIYRNFENVDQLEHELRRELQAGKQHPVQDAEQQALLRIAAFVEQLLRHQPDYLVHQQVRRGLLHHLQQINHAAVRSYFAAPRNGQLPRRKVRKLQRCVDDFFHVFLIYIQQLQQVQQELAVQLAQVRNCVVSVCGAQGNRSRQL